MKKSCEDAKKIVIIGLIGLVVFMSIMIWLLSYRTSTIYSLEMETYEKISEILNNHQGDLQNCNEQIQDVVSTFEDQREAVNEDVLSNGIKGLFLTLAVVAASLSNIIENVKQIVLDLTFFNKKGKKRGKDENPCTQDSEEEQSLCDRMGLTALSAQIEKAESEEIREIVQLINRLNEINLNMLPKENRELIENTITLLMQQLVKVLSHTLHITSEIDHSREQLSSSIGEIKKGVEYISEIVQTDDEKDRINHQAEIMAAIEQMNAGIEEMGLLLLKMQKRMNRTSLKEDDDKY
ncbi:MAG: hypothetical protein ACOYVK_18580 [Bacillota bacterium]